MASGISTNPRGQWLSGLRDEHGQSDELQGVVRSIASDGLSMTVEVACDDGPALVTLSRAMPDAEHGSAGAVLVMAMVRPPRRP